MPYFQFNTGRCGHLETVSSISYTRPPITVRPGLTATTARNVLRVVDQNSNGRGKRNQDTLLDPYTGSILEIVDDDGENEEEGNI